MRATPEGHTLHMKAELVAEGIHSTGMRQILLCDVTKQFKDVVVVGECGLEARDGFVDEAFIDGR